MASQKAADVGRFLDLTRFYSGDGVCGTRCGLGSIRNHTDVVEAAFLLSQGKLSRYERSVVLGPPMFGREKALLWRRATLALSDS